MIPKAHHLHTIRVEVGTHMKELMRLNKELLTRENEW